MRNNHKYLLLFCAIFFSFTKVFSQNISSAFVSAPILCYGGFALDSMRVNINQTPTPTQYKCLVGYHMNNTATPNTGVDYFLSYLSTQNTTASQLNFNGFLPNFLSGVNAGQTINYFVRIVDSTTYYPAHTFGNGASMVGVIDQFGPINFTEPDELIVTLLSTDIANCSGLDDGTANASASGGTPFAVGSPYDLLWLPGGQTTQAVVGLSAGAYTCTAIDANGCTSSSTTIVNAPVYGCTDPLAYNYDPLPTCDDGSCIAVVNGCTDPLAFNYDPTANTDDGSCIAIVNGCTDPTACNYDPNANTDDGSCLTDYGCTDPLAFNYDPLATCDDGSCIAIVNGCTDSTASNYNVLANVDDGSCTYCNNDTSYTYITACDSYTWDAVAYTASGVHTNTYTNASGCDSVATLDLTINNSTTGSSAVNACDTYTWEGQSVTISDVLSHTYVAGNATGCDSTHILTVVINNSTSVVVADTACGEYLFGANLLDSSGTYIDTFLTSYNCDSIVTLELTIYGDSSVTYITACDSAEWNGVWYYNDTTVTDTGFYTSYTFGGSTVGSSGKEGNVWHLGYGAGLDFNSGSPISISGQLSTLEGCASIADNNGDLLFYTDGSLVYNKNHTLMPNGTGLLGHSSSSQSGIIVKKPGSSTIYYLFTVDGMSGGAGGLYYSEVDMTLDGGLGDINSNKNINLIQYTCEKVTAVKHHNNADFWIISRERGGNKYYAFLLTSTGLNLPAITTNIGPVYTQNTIGYLKASPDGTMLAAADHWNFADGVDLFDFDRSTGILSNSMELTNLYSTSLYGIEFSPSGQYLYVSEETSNGDIYQYDLMAGSYSNINNSRTIIGSASNYGGALQLGPDQKIYHADNGTSTLGVIDSPNLAGSNCNYIQNGVILSYGSCGLGLPTFFSSIFNLLPTGCDSVATAIIDIKNSSSSYTNITACDIYTWALNSQTYYTSQIDTIQSTNIDGCQHIDSLELVIYPEINLTAIITDESCVNYSDGSIVLSATGGLGTFSYNWSGPGSFSETDQDIFNLGPGTYNLTITDVMSSCTKDTSFVIDSGFDMQVIISQNDISCYDANDGSIDIIPINLINPIYLWSDISSSLEDRTNMSPGLYYLQIDDNNCFIRDTFVFNQPDSLFIIAQQTPSVCVNGNSGEISVQAFGGTPSYSYFWSNWAGNSSVNSNLSPGVYDLDVYDNNGCLLEESFTISSYQLTVSSNIDHIDCYGDSTGSIDVTVSGGFFPYVYLWSDGTATEDIYNLSEGSVSCSIIDYLGCEISEFFIINEEMPIQTIVSINSVSCYGGNDGSASLNISGGVNPYNIDWYNIDENNLSEGTYLYEITDDNGCTFQDSIYVPQEDSLDITINVIDLNCTGNPEGEISISISSGGASPYVFSWMGPNSFTSSQEDIDNLYAGLYMLTLEDANGCVSEFQITVGEPTELSHYINVEQSNYSTYNISCHEGNDGWISVTPSGGYIPYTYLWSTGSTSSSITDLVAGTYNLTITNGIGCQETFVLNINEPSELLSAIPTSLNNYNGYDISCYGGSDGAIIVETSGGVSPYSYFWNNQIGFNPNISLSSGIYNLEVIDNNNCSYFEAIILDEPEILSWVVDIFPDTCEKGVGKVDILLSGGIAPYSYLWNYFEVLPVAIQVVQGEYFLEFSDANSCKDHDTVYVDNLIGPDIDFVIYPDYERFYKQLDDSIVYIDKTELVWQNVNSWVWDFGDSSYGYDSIVYHSYQDVGTYFVTLTIETDYGCIDTLTKEVVIAEYDLFIPNAFTPNLEDNINEGFRPHGIGIDEFLMNIYTRWGEKVFSTNDIEQFWNGRHNNEEGECQIGIYIYYIQVKDIFGAIHKYEGQLTLIR
tara:strand:+ start:2351 stop:7903 length:5553 start_codon:yes stop_codon:yes gene_type:complete